MALNAACSDGNTYVFANLHGIEFQYQSSDKEDGGTFGFVIDDVTFY